MNVPKIGQVGVKNHNPYALHKPISRRRFIEAFGLGSLGLYLLGGTSNVFADEEPGFLKAKRQIVPITHDKKDSGFSLILIVLQGGLSGFDSFDPRDENLDPNIVGPFKKIKTSASEKGGVYITEPLGILAPHMDKILVVRNLFHTNGEHNHAGSLVLTGSDKTIEEINYSSGIHPSPLVEVAEYIDGLPLEDNPYIGYVVMHHGTGRIINEDGTEGAPDKFPHGGLQVDHHETIYLPHDFRGNYWPLLPYEDSKERYSGRRNLLDDFERLKADLHSPPMNRHDKMHKKADKVLHGQFNDALDLSSEPDEVRERYGRNGFGNGLLIARRMVQRGARIVVANDGDYDHHTYLKPSLDKILKRFAQGLSALIEEKEKLGLPVVIGVITEFGRTPKINKHEGRDHWPNSSCMLLSGEGIQGGRFIGNVKNDGIIKGNALDGRLIGETLINLIGFGRVYTRAGLPTDERFPSLIKDLT